MKKNLVLITSFLLCLLGAGGCDNESIEEISPEDGETFTEQEVNGIAFKFCLLNEKGQPSTIFKEKENFSFYFSVTNNRKDTLLFIPDYAFSNDNDFCRVYSSNNQNKGKPYLFKEVELIGIAAYPFEPKASYTFQNQWIDNHNSIEEWYRGSFESAHQEPLNKGNYYTSFKYRFVFVNKSNNNPDIVTDTLNFKINFRIQ